MPLFFLLLICKSRPFCLLPCDFCFCTCDVPGRRENTNRGHGRPLFRGVCSYPANELTISLACTVSSSTATCSSSCISQQSGWLVDVCVHACTPLEMANILILKIHNSATVLCRRVGSWKCHAVVGFTWDVKARHWPFEPCWWHHSGDGKACLSLPLTMIPWLSVQGQHHVDIFWCSVTRPPALFICLF